MAGNPILIASLAGDRLAIHAFRRDGDHLRLLERADLAPGEPNRVAGQAAWFLLHPSDCHPRCGVFPEAKATVLHTAIQNTFSVSLPGEMEYVGDFHAEPVAERRAVLAVYIERRRADAIQDRLAEAGLDLRGFVTTPQALASAAAKAPPMIIRATWPDGTCCAVACREGLPRAWRNCRVEDPPSANRPWIEDCFVAEPRLFPDQTEHEAGDLLPEDQASADALPYCAARAVAAGRGLPFQDFLTAYLRRPATRGELLRAGAAWAATILLALLAGVAFYQNRIHEAARLREEATFVRDQAEASQRVAFEIIRKRHLLETVRQLDDAPVKLIDVFHELARVLPTHARVTSLRFDRKRGVAFTCHSRNRVDYLFLLEQMKASDFFLDSALLDEERVAGGEDGAARYRFDMQASLRAMEIPDDKATPDATRPE